jgi:hypothetical protein
MNVNRDFCRYSETGLYFYTEVVLKSQAPVIPFAGAMMESQKGFEVRNRPDWLYNALPYIYIVIGVIVVLGLGTENLIGVFSGILLISTGGIVFTMRATHRHELARLRAEFAQKEAGQDGDEGRDGDAERRQGDRRKGDRRKPEDDPQSLEVSGAESHQSDDSRADGR